jgi:hypothetical protein
VKPGKRVTSLFQGNYDFALHDKRFEDRFRNTPVVKGMHPNANASWRAKEGAIMGEVKRYRDICNSRKAFVYASSKLLYEFYCRGYRFPAILRVYTRAMDRNRTYYGLSLKMIINRVCDRFCLMCKRGVEYLDHPLALPYYPAHLTRDN